MFEFLCEYTFAQSLKHRTVRDILRSDDQTIAPVR